VARSIGKEASEADKAAAASLAQKEPPHVLLSKVRYAMDGGYYPEARTLLNSISEQDLPHKQHRTEFQYRWARLEHKTAQPEAAKQFYKRTIELAGDENWYFAPNSCLQIGYILLEEKNPAEAKKYFQKALTYKRHQYKNSIDSKARSALSQLR
jgi:tetratricopeptide (TPR) repeat protein